MRISSVAKVLIRRKKDGHYLILRSSKWEERPDRSQQPDLPGGVVEDGETPEVGCSREVQEEAGILVASSRLQLVHAQTFQSNRDGASITRLIYTTELDDDPDVVLSWEHEAFDWMTADEVLAMEIRQPYKDIFRYLHDVGVLK